MQFRAFRLGYGVHLSVVGLVAISGIAAEPFVSESLSTHTIDFSVPFREGSRFSKSFVSLMVILAIPTTLYVLVLPYIKYLCQGYVFELGEDVIKVEGAVVEKDQVTAYKYRRAVNDLLLSTKHRTIRLHPSWTKGGEASIRAFLDAGDSPARKLD